MKSTELQKRGKEFFDVKFKDKKDIQYSKTRVGYECMLVDYIDNKNGEQYKGMFKVLPEEFFSEKGIEMFEQRMKQEQKEFMMAQARIEKMKGR